MQAPQQRRTPSQAKSLGEQRTLLFGIGGAALLAVVVVAGVLLLSGSGSGPAVSSPRSAV